jgi:hypothetical protein
VIILFTGVFQNRHFTKSVKGADPDPGQVVRILDPDPAERFRYHAGP